MEEPLVECSFLIPILRDSDRQPHRPQAWGDLTVELRGLVKRFPRGHQGPRTVFHVEEDLTPGEYEEGAASGVTGDQSRKYWIAVPAEVLDELRGMLRRAANTFDQRAIYLSVAGAVEFVAGRTEDGPLNFQ